jgi:hypothetical protein
MKYSYVVLFIIFFFSSNLALFAVDIITKTISISEQYETESKMQSPGSSKPFVLPHNLPEKDYLRNWDCYYIRPPYSNNTIPLIASGINEYGYVDQMFYVYDITNDTFTELIDHDYGWVYLDTDHWWLLYSIFSPEWTLIITGPGFDMVLIDKDSKTMFNQRYKESDDRLLEFMLLEFKNTIFDNEYILETIKQINDTKENIITKYGAYIVNHTRSDNEGDETVHVVDKYYTNGCYYLLKRLEKYFDVDIYNEFIMETRYLYANIYDNGFYFYNENRLVFFDLKENKITKYTFDKNLSDLNNGYPFFHIYLSNDIRKIYIQLTTYNISLYEYDM